MDVVRDRSDFESRGTRCAGTLFTPATEEPPPVVVMAHGFGGERTWRLPAFAERFAAAGVAAFVFDYRSFGDSDGQPRDLVSPRRHLADWRAALAHVRGLETVDGDRVALWGTSFSGGHALVTAARDGDVDAVVAQVPFVDGLRTALHLVRSQGLGYGVQSVTAGVRDLGRAVLRRSPHYVPLVSDPGEFALLNTPDAKPSVVRMVPDGENWENRCAARVGLTLPLYRPLSHAADVDCPVFVAQASEDALIPAGSVDALVAALDDVERVRYAVGHFGAYYDEPFERLVDRETTFLQEHLGVA